MSETEQSKQATRAWRIAMSIYDLLWWRRKPATCADCGGPAFNGLGPRDGWRLEDGRTVCRSCCVADTHRLVSAVRSGDMEK